MKITKFGRIVEENGKIVLHDFVFNCEGGAVRVWGDVLPLIIERLKTDLSDKKIGFEYGGVPLDAYVASVEQHKLCSDASSFHALSGD